LLPMISKCNVQTQTKSEITAARIVKKLQSASFAAFFVGGCVRDRLIGVVPKDYDIATSARPDEVLQLFSRTSAVGLKFGVVQVFEEGEWYAISTFRSDGVYHDGRHPNQVHYTKDPQLDIQRRDFTINGLLYDPSSKQVLDFVGGQRDIRSGIVRTIGLPERRFQEDKLRLMRAIRFAARFRYDLEVETRRALHSRAHEIVDVSPERVRDELVKILTEGYAASGIRKLDEVCLLGHLLPDVLALKGVAQSPEFHPEGDVWTHTLVMLELMDQTKANGDNIIQRESLVSIDQAPDQPSSESPLPEKVVVPYPSLTLAMGVLLHDIGKPSTFELKDRIRFNRHAEIGGCIAAKVCVQLCLSKKQQDRVTALVRQHLKFKDLPSMKSSTLKRFISQNNFEEHLELYRLDCLGSHGNLDNWSVARKFFNSLKPEDIHPHPLLTGNDLIQMGYRPGPIFGRILRCLRDAQLEDELQTYQQAKEWVLSQFEIEPPRN